MPVADRAGEEAGFTLVELLVAVAAAGVIVLALFTLLNTTLQQTSRTFSQVNASQSARTATEDIEDELHSACLSSGMAPIQASSDGSDLYFISQYGSSGSNADAATPTPVEHKIVYSSSAKSLTDNIYAATGSSGSTWTFSTTPSQTRVLLTNVQAVGSTPMFQYFAYSEPMSGSTPYTDSAGNTYEMIQDGINYVPGTTIQPAAAPLATPLNSTNAGTAVEVLMTFVVGPNSNGGSLVETNLSNVGATVQDQIVLRLTPPANHAGNGATFTPCA